MNRGDHDFPIVALEQRERARIDRFKGSEIFGQPATISLMLSQRKIFQFAIVLVKADAGRLRRIRFEVVVEISIDQFRKRAWFRDSGPHQRQNSTAKSELAKKILAHISV